MKKHKVELPSKERQTFRNVSSQGRTQCTETYHAHILLKADSKVPTRRMRKPPTMFANVFKRAGISALERKPQIEGFRLTMMR